jgi:hypothetical protein
MSNPRENLIAKAKTGRFLFRYGYLTRESVAAKLRLYARRSGIADDIGKPEVNRIIASAFEGIPLEPTDDSAVRS